MSKPRGRPLKAGEPMGKPGRVRLFQRQEAHIEAVAAAEGRPFGEIARELLDEALAARERQGR